MSNRKVIRVVTGIHTRDGAGVKLTRVIGERDVRDFDPFLMLDALIRATRKIILKVFRGTHTAVSKRLPI